MTTYRNPWHEPHDAKYGPAFFSTEARAVEYRGFLIYERIKGVVWDVASRREPGRTALVKQSTTSSPPSTPAPTE